VIAAIQSAKPYFFAKKDNHAIKIPIIRRTVAVV
jgi:hypothetical protein